MSAKVKTLQTLEPLTSRLLEIRRIQSAASVLSWDQETYMPAGGGAARADQIATLEGLAHEKLVSPQIESLLKEWIDPRPGKRQTPGMNRRGRSCEKRGATSVARKNFLLILSSASAANAHWLNKPG